MRITKIHRATGFATLDLYCEQNESDQRYAGDAIRFKPSALGPTESPALSPVQSAMTPGLRASSSLILKTIFIKSEADVGDLRENAAAMRSAAAPRDSPMAKPMKHGPHSRRGQKAE